MKKVLVIISVVLSSYSIHAQRAEMEKIDIKIKQLPSRPLPIDIKTYAYKVMNTTQLPLPSVESLNGYFKLEGYTFSPTSPDVTLLVYLDNYQQKLSTTPVKGIKETKYAYVIKSSIDVRLSFLTGDNRYEFYQTSKLLKGDETHYSYQSSLTYSTEAEATEAGGKDETMFKNAKQECLNRSLFGIQQYLQQTCSYADIEITIPVWSIKSKSFDYSDMDEAQNKAISALKSYSDNGLNDDNKKSFHEAITIWGKALSLYNPEDKKGKINTKNVGALYANLALAHNWLMNDQEALKYVEMLNKSRGSSWADMIGDIVNSGIKGREQDAKRNNNTLIIEKTKSSYYVSPDFVVKGPSHRISSIQKNNFLNKNLPDERRHFEYTDNGLLAKTYTESYNPKTKSWEKRRDVHTIKYDHDLSVMYTYDEKSSAKPLVVRKFKDGKLVYQRSREGLNDSIVVKLYYNASGQLERYVKDPHLKLPTWEVRYQYANGRIAQKETFVTQGGQLKPNQKEEFIWRGANLEKIKTFTVDDSNKYRDTPGEIEYRYNEKGFLVGLSYVGWETQTFTIDEAGNIVEIHKRADDGGGKSPTYVWEPGSGNALLYTTEITSSTGPEKIPALY